MVRAAGSFSLRYQWFHATIPYRSPFSIYSESFGVSVKSFLGLWSFCGDEGDRHGDDPFHLFFLNVQVLADVARSLHRSIDTTFFINLDNLHINFIPNRYQVFDTVGAESKPFQRCERGASVLSKRLTKAPNFSIRTTLAW